MLLLFFACSEYELAGKGDEPRGDTGERPETGQPAIEVSPTVVDFGLHEVGLPRASEVFTISSVGELELTVSSVELTLHDGAFDLLAVDELTLEPGDSTDVVVTFEPPGGGSFAGLIEVHADDPDQPVTDVVLVGDAPGPDIDVSPWSHDFGTLDYGDSDSVALTISNIGDADLVVDELSYSATSDELTLDS
ncbi:MAG: choice-of-anchor D domain-containing protein, partial [Proteobacteria bacterium]|nr:choice-of-anchor D domain-containing protein [Pseudomonadota bacterium]